MKSKALIFSLPFSGVFKRLFAVPESQPLSPLVMITPVRSDTVVATPCKSHTERSWADTQEVIKQTYISEEIFGEYALPGGRAGGAGTIIRFFERHPEWNCSCQRGVSVPTWCLVE